MQEGIPISLQPAMLRIDVRKQLATTRKVCAAAKQARLCTQKDWLLGPLSQLLMLLWQSKAESVAKPLEGIVLVVDLVCAGAVHVGRPRGCRESSVLPSSCFTASALICEMPLPLMTGAIFAAVLSGLPTGIGSYLRWSYK